MREIYPPYYELEFLDQLESEIYLLDHLDGFRENRTNAILDKLQTYAENKGKFFSIDVLQVVENDIKEKYDRLGLKFKFDKQYDAIWKSLSDYNIHPELKFKKFLCSFNGTPHVSRKFLVAALHRRGWFDTDTCSKNFNLTAETLDGHLSDYLDFQNHRLYQKFFIGTDSPDFFNSIYSFGHVRYDHARNIYNLESKLTDSFLHLVSECMATSYYPFISEKFLFSIVTRGLFLSYAQPGWHHHLEKYYGFKKYGIIFDYRFDQISNPVERLIELMSMISKFSRLSSDEWRDLYLMESHTIEFNYDHYFSKSYLKHLDKFSQA